MPHMDWTPRSGRRAALRRGSRCGQVRSGSNGRSDQRSSRPASCAPADAARPATAPPGVKRDEQRRRPAARRTPRSTPNTAPSSRSSGRSGVAWTSARTSRAARPQTTASTRNAACEGGAVVQAPSRARRPAGAARPRRQPARREIGDDPADQRQHSKHRSRAPAPTSTDSAARRASPVDPADGGVHGASFTTSARRPSRPAPRPWPARLGFGAGGERADAHADAVAGRRLRDLGVGLQAELLDLCAGLARRVGIGEGADLDDEAAAVAAAAGLASSSARARRRRRRVPAPRRGASAMRGRLARRRRGRVGGLRAAVDAGDRGLGLARSRPVPPALRSGTGRVVRPGGGAAAATSRPASPGVSVTISSRAVWRPRRAPAPPTQPLRQRRAGGSGSGAARRRLRGISIGMSTGMGRGRVSNTSGKPITPMTSSTTAPIRRRRARVRACWTASPASLGPARRRARARA